MIAVPLLMLLALLAAPLATEAQPAKVARIGYLSPLSASADNSQRLFEAFRNGLTELGYAEGRNIAIESRWAAGKYERLPSLGAELVRLRMDVIVTAGVPAILAAKKATSRIPIIMAVVVDPISWERSWRCSRRSLPKPHGWPSSGILQIPATHHS